MSLEKSEGLAKIKSSKKKSKKHKDIINSVLLFILMIPDSWVQVVICPLSSDQLRSFHEHLARMQVFHSLSPTTFLKQSESQSLGIPTHPIRLPSATLLENGA